MIRRGLINASRRNASSTSQRNNVVRATAAKAEPFINGTNANYVEGMYYSWLEDPKSVHSSWQTYFASVNAGVPPGSAYQPPPGLGNSLLHPSALPVAQTAVVPGSSSGVTSEQLDKHVAIQRLIRSYQVRGHHLAKLDPLGILDADLDSSTPEEILAAEGCFTDADMDMQFDITKMNTFIGGSESHLPLKEIIKRLQKSYCDTIAVEYMHIGAKDQCDFIRERLETPSESWLTPQEKMINFKRLVQATKFEEFLAKKFVSEKRFGLEGVEMLIPALKAIVDAGSRAGIESVIMGMPHRGRLNVIANVVRKDMAQLFSQFDSKLEPEDIGQSGDVKYHLGISHERINYSTNKLVNLVVCANPSHLEAVDPVVQGKTRAEQFYREDHDGDRVMSILMHGDAAFSGQGVVYETLHLGDLPNYTTHGTIHVVANNQIGFTTDPRFSRSSPYCTDVARVVGAPILHVNGDDCNAVVHVAKVAAEFRQRFKKDVVIDIVGYRRHGHNEIDNPMFTQPLMYQRIAKLDKTLDIYGDQLVKEGVMSVEEQQASIAEYEEICEDSFKRAKDSKKLDWSHWLDSPWKGFFQDDEGTIRESFPHTGLPELDLAAVSNKVSEFPKEFQVHGGLKRILKARQSMVADRQCDWALGEAMAFGTLLKEGVHVRLSGQDVERGTFSHRHAVLHDQTTDGKTICPLQHLDPNQAPFVISNSSLSEYGVLGFELGYSMVNPNSLILWEAQFGDFSNTAQPIIDQFISSGETKWRRQSGLVMLLPHGYEGMGPEHSSCRMERFLQMSDDDPDQLPSNIDAPDFKHRQLNSCNWIIANITTPANYFHILRRQIKMPFRKPLVIMSPKFLLRHPDARSSFDDMTEGTDFKRIIPETQCFNPESVRRLIFCSGKVAIDLENERAARGLGQEIAICRIEQVAPFPFDKVKEELEKYPAADIYWCQEEHKNMGPYEYCKARIRTTANWERRVHYAGRANAAAAATGSKQAHINEQQYMYGLAFDGMEL